VRRAWGEIQLRKSWKERRKDSPLSTGIKNVGGCTPRNLEGSVTFCRSYKGGLPKCGGGKGLALWESGTEKRFFLEKRKGGDADRVPVGGGGGGEEPRGGAKICL